MLYRTICTASATAGLLVAAMVSTAVAGETGSDVSTILINPTIPMSVTGGNDVQRLKDLAGGVGCDMIANPPTYARLKPLGITSMRVINVDIAGAFNRQGQYVIGAPIHFKKKWRQNCYTRQVGQQGRMTEALAACHQVGAIPNVVIATAMPPQICLPLHGIPKSQRGSGPFNRIGDFGPTNWRWFRNYCRAIFKYVMIDQKFSTAEFSVGNEPEISTGNFFVPRPPWPATGSRTAYRDYFKMYKEVARAARKLQRTHPALNLSLGPALVWVADFTPGAFHWTRQFLRDCARQKVKLDFLGIHYYGNQSSLDGQYPYGQYPFGWPSVAKMLQLTAAEIHRYCPGVRIEMTEWGASFNLAAYNGNNVGAAWAAAFLNTLLQGGVAKAYYLLSTDDLAPQRSGYHDVWDWMGLLTNPIVCNKMFPKGQVVKGGQIFPKATAHVFEMIHRLAGTRVETKGYHGAIGCFASADKADRFLTVLLWNYDARLAQKAVDDAWRETVTLRIDQAQTFFEQPQLHFRRWLVSRTVSNAYYLMKHGQLDERRAALQMVDGGDLRLHGDQADIRFVMPPSSVSLVQIDTQQGQMRK